MQIENKWYQKHCLHYRRVAFDTYIQHIYKSFLRFLFFFFLEMYAGILFTDRFNWMCHSIPLEWPPINRKANSLLCPRVKRALKYICIFLAFDSTWALTLFLCLTVFTFLILRRSWPGCWKTRFLRCSRGEVRILTVIRQISRFQELGGEGAVRVLVVLLAAARLSVVPVAGPHCSLVGWARRDPQPRADVDQQRPLRKNHGRLRNALEY